MKKFLLATALMFTVPAAANAQSDWFSTTSPTYQGFYIGAQGGLNWLLNNQSYVMLVGMGLVVGVNGQAVLTVAGLHVVKSNTTPTGLVIERSAE